MAKFKGRVGALPAGSLPPILTLLSITGPLDIQSISSVDGGPEAFGHTIATIADYSDDELVALLYAVLWNLRGRNGLLVDHEHD